MNITQKTYKKNVQRFGIRTDKAFEKLMKFAKKHKFSDKDIDNLTSIIDTYIVITAEMERYCRKNDINSDDFGCDVMNNCSGKCHKEIEIST